jgi:hypothetical protein
MDLLCTRKNQGLVQKRKPQKKCDDQAFIARFKNFGNKKKFGSRKKPNQEKDMSKIQCFNCRKYGHYKNHCPELNKRKETHEASVVEEREPSKKTKQDKNILLLLRQGNNILHSSCTYHVYIVYVHIYHIYFLEDKMFKEKQYLWKNKKIRIDITMTLRQAIHMER